MSLLDFEIDYDSSSSSDSSLSMSKCLLDDSLDEEEAEKNNSHAIIQSIISVVLPTVLRNNKFFHGGSSSRRRYIHRERQSRYNLIMNDYFKGEISKYKREHFRRRYRMHVELFKQILQAVKNYDDYFTLKMNAARKVGVSPLQKVMAAIRMLAQGCATDALDEYLQIGETTAIESLKRFCDAIIGTFEEQHLRKPNKSDIEMLLKEGDARRFPGMLGSLDCMHWHWKNCPTAWYGTHTNGFKKVPTLILEVVASQSLWIWHAFFGMDGTNNDINVLDKSPLFDDLINNIAPPCDFIVQGHRYNM